MGGQEKDTQKRLYKLLFNSDLGKRCEVKKFTDHELLEYLENYNYSPHPMVEYVLMDVAIL